MIGTLFLVLDYWSFMSESWKFYVKIWSESFMSFDVYIFLHINSICFG